MRERDACTRVSRGNIRGTLRRPIFPAGSGGTAPCTEPAPTWQPHTRVSADAPGRTAPQGRPLHHRHLRRLRRPDETQARPRPLQPGARRAVCPTTSRSWVTPGARSATRRFGSACERKSTEHTGGTLDAQGLALAGAAALLSAGRSASRPRTSPIWSRRWSSSTHATRPRGTSSFIWPPRPICSRPWSGQLEARGLTAEDQQRPLAAGGGGKTLRPRSGFGARAQPGSAARPAGAPDLPDRSLSGQRRRSRTCSCSASRTASSSRSGTAATSTTCRSRWPRRWGWRAGAATTIVRAPCGTWSPTTSSS